MARVTTFIFALSTIALCHPLLPQQSQSLAARTPGLTLANLLAIAPTSASCAGAPYPSECRTATDALPYITSSFARYGITHPSVQAALVSLMAYETADFKYNINHYPGVPGQGTRNMQSPAFNLKYLEYLVGQGMVPNGEEVLAQVQGGDVGALMGVVGQDEWSFGSAAWFMTSQCPFSAREGMWEGGQVGWEEYLTGCVGAAVDDGRVAYWQRAVQALGTA